MYLSLGDALKILKSTMAKTIFFRVLETPLETLFSKKA
jgi:hypothetical protein